MTSPPPTGLDERATADVLRSLVDNTQLLVRKEIELAKLEVKQMVVARLMAVALAVIAAVLGLYLVGFLGVTAAKALELVVAEWLAWLIVSGVVLVLIVVALLVAKRKLTHPPTVPEQTKATVDETVTWAKQQVQR